MKKMTCDEFDKLLNNEYYYSDIHSDMYWRKGFDSDKIFKMFKNEAEKREIILTDVDTWDYDTNFYENYKNDSDKGNS